MSCGAGNTARESQRTVAGKAGDLRRKLAQSVERLSLQDDRRASAVAVETVFAELEVTQTILRELLEVLDHAH